jgi:hypothetical protein
MYGTHRVILVVPHGRKRVVDVEVRLDPEDVDDLWTVASDRADRAGITTAWTCTTFTIGSRSREVASITSDGEYRRG